MAEIPPRIEKILDLARWAPSGDNTQPWRFEIIDEANFVIHGSDTRDWCVYDLDGRASQIAIGALMENIAIAASEQQWHAEFIRRQNTSETRPTIDVQLIYDDTLGRDPLVDFIQHRVTQRRPFSTTPLSPVQKERLERSVGPEYSVTWIESTAKRWQMAKLLSRNARIRLTIPEAYEVHRRIIEWDTKYSEDRIPDQAVGLDPVGLKLMRWAMQDWKRVDFLNRYLAGTWLPRLQLDLIPGFFCGAHFLISARANLSTEDDYLHGGRVTQRFWLTAAQQGLQFQPEMTPVIFSRYIREKQQFTHSAHMAEAATFVAADLRHLLGEHADTKSVFMGRMGTAKAPANRSTRMKLGNLIISG